jgi:hypothetical protein
MYVLIGKGILFASFVGSCPSGKPKLDFFIVKNLLLEMLSFGLERLKTR